jgi:hypothetical protein
VLESTPRLAATPAAEAVAYKYGLLRAPALASTTSLFRLIPDVLAIASFAFLTGACIWLIVLIAAHPSALEQPNVLFSGYGPSEDIAHRQQWTAKFYAQTFATAYLWSLFYLLRQLRNFTLSPLAFLECSLHIVVALFLAFLLRPLISDFDQQSSGVLSTIFAILAGMHRWALAQLKRGIVAVTDAVNASAGRSAFSQTRTTLRQIDGLDETVISELKNCEIDNVHALATANPILLYVETRFSLLQIVDWIGQAQLIVIMTPSRFAICKSLGIRTVFDLVQEGALAQFDLEALKTLFAPGDKYKEELTWDQIRYWVDNVSKSLHVKRLLQIQNVFSQYLPSERTLREDFTIEASYGPIEQRMVKAISNALSGESLTRYTGWVLAQFEKSQSFSDKLVVLIRFYESRPEWGEPALIKIEEGEIASSVEFDLEMRVGYSGSGGGRKTVTVPAHGNSMGFHVEAERADGDSNRVWVQVFQRNRLIQVIRVTPSDAQAELTPPLDRHVWDAYSHHSRH